jgi:hypothetical protein
VDTNIEINISEVVIIDSSEILVVIIATLVSRSGIDSLTIGLNIYSLYSD